MASNRNPQLTEQPRGVRIGALGLPVSILEGSISICSRVQKRQAGCFLCSECMRHEEDDTAEPETETQN